MMKTLIQKNENTFIFKEEDIHTVILKINVKI